jgi:hypothetical protein
MQVRMVTTGASPGTGASVSFGAPQIGLARRSAGTRAGMAVMKSCADRRTSRVSKRLGAVVATVFALAGGAVAPTGAGAAELPRSGVSGAGSFLVDVGPDGWAGRISQDPPSVVRLAAPGVAFGAPLPLDLRDAYAPSITMGPGGAALVLWTTGGPDPLLMYAYRPAGGAFGAPGELDDEYPLGEQAPVVAFDAAGDATVVWASAHPDDRLLVRTLSAAGTWGPVQEIRAPRAFRPSLAVAPSGGAVLAWSEDGPRRNSTRVVAALRPAGGTFGAPQTLAGIQRNPGEPVVAINDHGTAVAAWIELHGETTFTVSAAFRRPGAAEFGKAIKLTPAEEQGASPSVSVAPDGRMVLVWSDFHLNTSEAWARIRTRNGLLRPAHRLSDHAEGNSGAIALATTPALVAWYQRSHHHTSALETAAARVDGTFSPPRTRFGVPDFGDDPLLFADPAGVVFISPAGGLVRSAG